MADVVEAAPEGAQELLRELYRVRPRGGAPGPRAMRAEPTRPARRPVHRDRWWARDKARHLVFSGLWTLSTQYVLVHKAGWSDGNALPASVASSATVGLAKELYDASRIGGRASGKDLVANAVGIGLAVGVIAL